MVCVFAVYGKFKLWFRMDFATSELALIKTIQLLAVWLINKQSFVIFCQLPIILDAGLFPSDLSNVSMSEIFIMLQKLIFSCDVHLNANGNFIYYD